MLHKRLATDIRSHFSTVGPSPAAPSPAVTDAALPEAPGPRLVSPATPFPHSATPTPHPDSPSLLVLPPSPPGSPGRSPLLPEFLAITAHRCASFFAEAAVLVLIFGILDRLLSRGHVELPWIAGTFAATLALLVASILTDLSARRWLRTR